MPDSFNSFFPKFIHGDALFARNGWGKREMYFSSVAHSCALINRELTGFVRITRRSLNARPLCGIQFREKKYHDIAYGAHVHD